MARDGARRPEIPVPGTLGILVAAVQRGVLSRTEGKVEFLFWKDAF